MNQSIIIENASLKDAQSIYALMEYARIENEKKGFFCADQLPYIEEHLTDPQKGFILKAVADEQLVGFFIIHFPHLDENNLASYSTLPKEAYNLVAHFDSAVVNPDYRGHKIMGAFLTRAEELLSQMPYEHYFSTVHPDNRNSLQNLLNHHFEIITTTKKYGGLDRHVMYKHR